MGEGDTLQVGHVGQVVDAVDAVCSGHTMQYAVDAVCSGHSMQWNSGIWWWGHCLWCKKVKPVDAVDTVHSGRSRIVVYGGGDIVFGTKRSSTASTGLTFLHHIPLFHCVHCILCPLRPHHRVTFV